MELTRDVLQIVTFVGHLQGGKSSVVSQLLANDDEEKQTKNKGSDKSEDEENHTNTNEPRTSIIDKLEIERITGRTFIHTYHFLNSPTVIQNTPGSLKYFKEIYRSIVLADAMFIVVSAEQDDEFLHTKTTKVLCVAAFVAGIKNIIVLINKMDTCQYSNETFTSKKNETLKVLKLIGYPITSVITIPICGITGGNIIYKDDNMKWYKGPTVQLAIKKIEPRKFDSHKPFLLPIQKVNCIPRGTIVVGRIISGYIETGTVISFPNGEPVVAKEMQKKNEDVKIAFAGDFVSVLVGTRENKNLFRTGRVFNCGDIEFPVVKSFTCKVKILRKKPIKVSSHPTLTCFCAQGPCIWETMEKDDKNVTQVKKGQIAIVRVVCLFQVNIAPFKENPELGRVWFRFHHEIVAAGVVIECDKKESISGRLTKAAR